MAEATNPFTAVILAGKRPGKDPVAEAAGVACKSFAPIGGRAMVLRVLDALAATRQVGSQILCGPSQSIIAREPELKARIETGQVKWMDSLATPSASTYRVLQSLPPNIPVLVTTADHALLSAQIVDFFCDQARRSGCDLAVGLASYKGVREAFPETRRTAIKFNDDAYCGCNLFGFLNQQSHRAAAFWRQIEQERKKPLHMMRVLGWWTVLQYISGRFSLAQGLEKLSAKIHIRVRAVLLPFPQAAVDVDTVDDWHFVQQLAQRQSL
ncbi:MAG: nucleotidyltransferase family protein [Desulfobacterales bacterium]|jgi:GTP:adenosylcobinamide-phosphate guanylyltransferase